MSDLKKNSEDGHGASDSPLDSFLKAWSRNMDSHQVGKYSHELDSAQAKPIKGCSHEDKS